MDIDKLELDKDVAFLTLAFEEARDTILEHGSIHNNEKLKVSIIHDRKTDNPSKLHISTTLLVNNLPQKESQSAIVKTIKRLFNDHGSKLQLS